jgi:hypothetical protein
MTLATVRAAAIDRALVGDDPESALALAGVVDGVVRGTVDRTAVDGVGGGRVADTDVDTATDTDPFTAAMLAVGCLGHVSADRTLDERAWRPGRDADAFVVAGAAVAVRERGVAVDRAAALAGCAPATLDAVVEQQRRKAEK